MGGFVRHRLGGYRKDQKGFTLIEMLVVIGIIVALAAVIVPLVIQFSGEGAAASADAEWDTVQTTIDILMADNELDAGSLTGNATTAAIILETDDLDGTGPGPVLSAYTRDPSTNYCYTWDTTGRLLTQWELDSATTTGCSATEQSNP